MPDEVGRLAEQGAVTSGIVALLHALVGDREGTVRWMARAVEDGSWVDLYPGVNSAFAPFRGDDDFQAALRGVQPS